MKKCACGVEYKHIPANPKEWDLKEHGLFWMWNCVCTSTLVYPKDEATAEKRGLKLLPTYEQYGEMLDQASDLYKARKEQEIIEEDHLNWWENNRPVEDD